MSEVAPPVLGMILDEATGVLEAHVLAALATTLEHLVMIGDHKQPRPQVIHHLQVTLESRPILLWRIVALNVALTLVLDTGHSMACWPI